MCYGASFDQAHSQAPRYVLYSTPMSCRQQPGGRKVNKDKYDQLIEQGFCLFEHVLDDDLLRRLRDVTDRLVMQQSAEAARRQVPWAA